MSTDFRWQSRGGILLDGNGDIATTRLGSFESLQDMVRTRLKAALHSWKLYRIGADLQAAVGQAITPELELNIRRQVAQSLTTNLLPRGSFRVETLSENGVVTVFVYVDETLLATADVRRDQLVQVR